MTKCAVLNFSGNVGKSTVARHLLAPRLNNPEVFSIESINSDGHGEQLKGKEYVNLQEYMMTIENAVVDVGASNVEDFIKVLTEYHGSHEDFDYFVVPVTPDVKQQQDTIGTLDALRALGVPGKKVRLVFNMLSVDDNAEKIFPGLFRYAEETKNAVAKPEATMLKLDVYQKMKGVDKSLAEIAGDKTDYRAMISQAKDDEEKQRYTRMVLLQRGAVTANNNLDAVFKVLFK